MANRPSVGTTTQFFDVSLVAANCVARDNRHDNRSPL
jgi:hypothetical protein